MQLARVVGSVVATRKEESIQGLKLLLVRPLDDEGRESGNAIVSADAVGAGPDEIVLIAAGSSARQTAAGRVGDVVAVHVIARPHDQVDAVMPLGRPPVSEGKKK